jgi:endoglucanase Acf2
MRARALKIVNENFVKQFFIYIRTNNLKKEENLGNYLGVEHANRFNQLIYFAATEEIISLSKAASLAGETLIISKISHLNLHLFFFKNNNILKI